MGNDSRWSEIPSADRGPTEDRARAEQSGYFISLPSQIIFLPRTGANQSAGPTVSTREALQPFSFSLLLLCPAHFCPLSPPQMTLLHIFLKKKRHLHKNCLSFPSPNLAANLHLCSVSVFLCAKKKDSLPCVCPVVVTARALDHALSGFHLQIALTSGPSVVLTTDRTWPRLFSERIHSSFSDSR